jgi:membrane-associated protein
MEWPMMFVDLFVHLDKHLATAAAAYGVWIYAILFAIVFAETGLVIAPFLPGDSLLFVAGSLAALGGMDVHFLVVVLFAAAVFGNLTNYEVGRWLAPRAFADGMSRWLNPRHLLATHRFFDRWGPVAVVVARFVPFLRTYVPFVAGIGAMHREQFVAFSVIGGALWVGAITYLGYFFGNIPWMKANLGAFVLAIIVISVLPVLLGVVKARIKRHPAS